MKGEDLDLGELLVGCGLLAAGLGLLIGWLPAILIAAGTLLVADLLIGAIVHIGRP